MIFLMLWDKLIKYKLHLYFLGFFLLSCSQSFQTFVVRSPDCEIEVNIFEDKKYLRYSVTYNNKNVIAKSKLGLEFKNGTMFPGQNFSSSFEVNAHKNIWELPWGETRKIKDHYNEAKITFENNQNVIIGHILF